MTRIARINGKIGRAASGRVTTCPCCGGGECVCDEDDTISLPSCCCLSPSDPAYCGDDEQMCAAPCLIPGGLCPCGASGPGISVPACCCIPLDHPLSCAANVAACYTPCHPKQPCGGACPCCTNSCGYGLGAFSSNFSGTKHGFYGSDCSKKQFLIEARTVCSGVVTACGVYSGTCTHSGKWISYDYSGAETEHWEGTWTEATGTCRRDWQTDTVHWISGPVTPGVHAFRVGDCYNPITYDLCRLRATNSGASSDLPCDSCATAATCTLPGCGGGARGMGCQMSPGYEILPSGLLAPIRAIEMSRLIDPSACPLCARTGWNGVWRSEGDLRGRRRASATSHQQREKIVPHWKKRSVRGGAGLRSVDADTGRRPVPPRTSDTDTARPRRRSVPPINPEMERRMQQQMNAASGHDPRRCGGCGG